MNDKTRSFFGDIEDSCNLPIVKYPWLFIIVPVMAFLALRHSFDLALWGDDFLAIFINESNYGEFDIKNYFHPYGGTFLVMYPLGKLFSLQSFPYYLISFILKVLASISIYFFALGVSRKRLAGMVASLLFSVGFVGLDTTNWTLKMNAYVGIIFLSAFVYISFLSKRKESLKIYLLAIVFFLLALFIAISRMHGFLIFFLMEIRWLVRKLEKKTVMFYLSRILLLGISIYFLKALGCFYHTSANIERFKHGYLLAHDLFDQGNYDFFLYPFSTLGNIILPDAYYGKIWQFINSSVSWKPFYKNAAFSGVLWLIFNLAFGLNLFSRKGKIICLPVLTASSIWTLILIFVFLFGSANISQFAYIGPTLLAGYFIILGSWLFFLFRKSETNFSDSAIFLTCFVILFFLTPQLVSPQMSIWSSHRYLTFSFAGFAVFLGCLASFSVSELTTFNQNKSKFFRIVKLSSFSFSVLIISAIAFSNVAMSNHYLKQQVEARGKRPDVWKTLVKSVPEIKEIAIFYITHDNTTYAKFHGLLSFGFQPQGALIYNIKDQAKWPYITDNFETLVKILEEGELSQYGTTPQPVGLKNVYSFDLVEDKLVNTRQEVIERLKVRLGQVKEDSEI